MRRAWPPFGFISGLATTLGFLPHIVALGFFLLSMKNLGPVMILFIFSIASKILGEWLFWGKFLPFRLDRENTLLTWRSTINKALFHQTNVSLSLIFMLVDFLSDVLIVVVALKTLISPTWLLLVFLGCQSIAAPIQGIISDFFCRKKTLLFSLITTALAVLVSLEIANGLEPGSSPSFYINLLGLNHFATSTQMLIVLCVKGLLVGTTVTCRASIADSIQIETERRFNKT